MGSPLLYIEDHPVHRMLVKRALEAHGYTLLEVPNELSGMEMPEKAPLDLILLDIHLPDIDGYEVARRVRSSSKLILISIPIIPLPQTH